MFDTNQRNFILNLLNINESYKAKSESDNFGQFGKSKQFEQFGQFEQGDGKMNEDIVKKSNNDKNNLYNDVDIQKAIEDSIKSIKEKEKNSEELDIDLEFI